MRTKLLQTLALGVALGMAGCGSGDAPNSPGEGSGGTSASGTGGSGSGGTTATGGSQGTGGSGSGGINGTGGSGAGGTRGTGGSGSGGTVGTGGAGTGGSGTGGTVGTGGASSGTGGKTGTGGTSSGTGGRTGAGGATTGGSTGSCEVGTPLSGGVSHCSSNASGNMGGGYSWTIWSDGSAGCIITYDNQGCAFKATWNNSGNFLARTGLGWNSTQTYDQLGTISADFAETKTGTGGGWSYIGIYGWSKSPLVEYYIIDDWFGKPNPGKKLATIEIDGGKYDIFSATRTNAPSIEGTQTFPQFFSVRQTARQCGHISITQHFDEWKKVGLTLGKMYEARILVEVGNGSGSVDFTKATLTAVK